MMSASFGQHRWPLAARELSFPASPDRYRYFARFLLEGGVVPALAAFVPHLKNQPNIFQKPWVKDRVVAVLQTLVDAEVDSKARLLARLAKEPRCACSVWLYFQLIHSHQSAVLLSAYSLWLNSEKHSDLVTTWMQLPKLAAE